MPQKLNLIREDEICSFAALLQRHAPGVLLPDSYPYRYLRHLIQSSVYYSHVYAHILNQLLQLSGRDRSQLSLVDYGAGNGLLGLLAVYTGFGKVYLNDQDAGFLDAARQMSAALKLEPAGFIEGGVEKLLAFFADRQPPDLLAGSDVIEHIYDLPGFIKALQSLNPKLITAFSTACNPRNPFQRRRFQKIQLRDEYEGGTPDLHPLFAGQPLEPFILSRQHIIESKAANRLSATQIAAMAKATRGLKKADIELAVDVYLNTGKQPQPPQDPTNTCDPITGSWSERMLPLQVYQELYQSAGFFLTVRDGFYNQYDARKSSLLRWMANRLIPFSAHTVAPYIILVGKPHA